MPRKFDPANHNPANDNEDPDESWQRADLILSAYSGADLNVTANQKLAMTQLLTDLMHYCEVMSMGKRSDHPDYIDFDKVLDHATANYLTQSHMMNSVIDAEIKRFGAGVDKAIAEGRFGPTKEQEPDEALERLLDKLSERQDEEALDLARTQEDDVRLFGATPEVLQEHVEQKRDQFLKFREERSRHIRDYEAAKALRADLDGEERSKTAGLDPDDEPKLSK